MTRQWKRWTRRAHVRRFVCKQTNKKCMRGYYFTKKRTRNACKEICSQIDDHMKHVKVQAKEEHAHGNIDQTPRPSKTSHTLPCIDEAMIHQEHIHHSTSLQLNMDITSSMNILVVSCQFVSWVILATSLLWPYCFNQCNVMWKSKRTTCNVEESCNLMGVNNTSQPIA